MAQVMLALRASDVPFLRERREVCACDTFVPAAQEISAKKKLLIQIFIAMEQIRITAEIAVKETADGANILPTEPLTSSRPTTRIMTATSNPDKYSYRAWP